MGKILVTLLGLVLLGAGCAADNLPMEEGSENATVEERVPNKLTVLTDDLTVPWSIEKTGNTFYLTERTGSIVQIEGEQKTRQTVKLANPLATTAEAGLMGFVLAPDFEESQQAYAYYTYTDEQNQFNKVVLLRLANNEWAEEAVLLDQIPSGPYHNGGRLKIGPDNKLYVSVGDASEENSAQQLDSLSGKILRMNLDGSIPEDNPFANSYVYSYGHRNVQGLVWLSDGRMYASEHGNSANDEINQIEAGANYGWPLIEGTQKQNGLVTPTFTSGAGNTWAPSGMAVHGQKLYVAGLRGNAVFVFDLETNEQTEVLTDFGRIRDVYIEEEELYFITNNTDGRGNPKEADDKFYRIGLLEID